MLKRATPLVIGIAGGSASGKTTLAHFILEQVGENNIAYLPHDAYYKDLRDLPSNEHASINFDHPNSLDSDLLVEHIQRLAQGQAVDLPVYDFEHDTRTGEYRHIEPKPVVMVEGILIFTEAKLRELFDVKLFVDTDADLRLIRRLERDLFERGRSAENIIRQYLATVRPMHLEFVEPSKRYADIIIPEGGMNPVALEMVVARIQALLQQEEINLKGNIHV